jgi:hypothetical protein
VISRVRDHFSGCGHAGAMQARDFRKSLAGKDFAAAGLNGSAL